MSAPVLARHGESNHDKKKWCTAIRSESKKPNLNGSAFCLTILVPTAGFELAT